MGAEAKMAVAAKCQMLVGLAPDIQPVRIFETFRIPICRTKHKGHPLAGRDRNIGKSNFSDRSARRELHRAIETKQLFDG